jgi:hypothetical protein
MCGLICLDSGASYLVASKTARFRFLGLGLPLRVQGLGLVFRI